MLGALGASAQAGQARGRLKEGDQLRLARRVLVIGGLTLKGQPTRIILGPERFSEELREYLANKDAWESRGGPLEYVDLRFDDRIYFKPLPPIEVAALNLPKEEAE